jgi:hypothetical protein
VNLGNRSNAESSSSSGGAPHGLNTKAGQSSLSRWIEVHVRHPASVDSVWEDIAKAGWTHGMCLHGTFDYVWRGMGYMAEEEDEEWTEEWEDKTELQGIF